MPQNFDIWLVLPHSNIKCDFVFDSKSIEVENKLKWLAGSLLQERKKNERNLTRLCTQNENLKRFLPCFLFRCIPVWKKHTQSNWADVRDMPEWRVLHTQQAAPSIWEPVNKMILGMPQTDWERLLQWKPILFLFLLHTFNKLCWKRAFFSAFFHCLFFFFLFSFQIQCTLWIYSHRNRSKL